MAKLVYTPCKCIRRGDAFLPGTRGDLSIVTKKSVIPVSKCRYCTK